MKRLRNAGAGRAIDLLRERLPLADRLDIASPRFSLFAFGELRAELETLSRVRLLLPAGAADLGIFGDSTDRALRNQLQTGWLAARCADWIASRVELRRMSGALQSALILRDAKGTPLLAINGAAPFSTGGLGLAPSEPGSYVHATETQEESADMAQWFDELWNQTPQSGDAQATFEEALTNAAAHRAPAQIYAAVLHHLFFARGEALDEEQIIKTATGIRETAVWKKLYKFQRDGVIGAIDKLNRFGGCIIADSVGLGKTFQALAIIRYHEIRNERVLVLCPKRLRDNWSLYRANDRRNTLAADRFKYDIFNHTDLSREKGQSDGVDLSYVNWGNYDLVVIDESHNFRNKRSAKTGSASRYERLMQQVIQAGVRTRVLMLSATPVNNRLADLRNQIAFATEGRDDALADHGIDSIDSTTRLAQKQFNAWLDLEEQERTPARLIEMLGFDYFTLLDLLTIARSRKHIERYYGLAETGEFPERRRPINHKPEVDLSGAFPAIHRINHEIRNLNLAAYGPLRYILPEKKAAYDARYSTQLRGGKGVFLQADREASLIHLLRVNVLKRMESSVQSFALTLERQQAEVEAILQRIESSAEDVAEPEIEDIDLDDPAFESLLFGDKVKVLLKDMDLIRWKHELLEDCNRLDTLLQAARQVTPDRDAKLATLKEVIREKCRNPLNSGNRKALIFTAFIDTANYLYANLAAWARAELGLQSALVIGSGGNQHTLPDLPRDLASILSAFAPRARERPEDLADTGEIDLLIATDCISEGQNLQDCDWLINYDIHWNPVRIIQRFGRIDRIGSPNRAIQLVNFWPNMELEEYIDLERRVSGKMILLDISATGEENLIESDSPGRMNDLEYRRKQLLKLQDVVIDLEDLSSGVSIADLTLGDFRLDLADYMRARPGDLDHFPPGGGTAVSARDVETPPGVIFCLRATDSASGTARQANHPLAPYYLVHIGLDGETLLPYTQAKRILDRLKRLCVGRDLPDASACAAFDRMTRGREDMSRLRELLAAAVASIDGKQKERAAASLFRPGGTHALAGEFAGADAYEAAAYLLVLPA